MDKQLPAVIENKMDIHVISEYGSIESALTNVILPIMTAHLCGVRVPHELSIAANELLQDYLESI